MPLDTFDKQTAALFGVAILVFLILTRWLGN